MAKGNFGACLAVVLQQEGGFVDNPHDPGGVTNMGITLKTLSAWRGRPATRTEMRNLGRADVEPIYLANYWKPVRGETLPAGLDLAIFDYGVNSGPGRALKDLAASKQDDVRAWIQALCARRLGFLHALATWSAFGRGWGKRVATIEATSVAMALTAAKAGNAPAALRQEAERASLLSATHLRTASGVGAGGAGSGLVTGGLQLDWWLVGGIAAAIVLVAALVWARGRQHAERATAYRRAAAEVAVAMPVKAGRRQVKAPAAE